MTVEQAQKEIALILAKLEEDTGQLVGSIAVEPIEVTSLQDSRPIHQMQVQIALVRLPGHQW